MSNTKQEYKISDSAYETIRKNKKNILALFDNDEEINKALDEITSAIENVENTYGFEDEPAINLSKTINDLTQIIGTKGSFKFDKDDAIDFNFISRESGDAELPLTLISGGVAKNLKLSENASLDIKLVEDGTLVLSNLIGVALGDVFIKNMFQVVSVAIDLSSKANVDLTNVINGIFKAKGINSGLASIEQIDEIGNKKVSDNLTFLANIETLATEKWVKDNQPIKDLSKFNTQREVYDNIIENNFYYVTIDNEKVKLFAHLKTDISVTLFGSRFTALNKSSTIYSAVFKGSGQPILITDTPPFAVGTPLSDKHAINKLYFENNKFSLNKPLIKQDGDLSDYRLEIIRAYERGDIVTYSSDISGTLTYDDNKLKYYVGGIELLDLGVGGGVSIAIGQLYI